VNIVDIILLLDVWGDCAAIDARCELADLDCNQKIDLFDLVIMLQKWNPPTRK
jgi:hypothetical protein